MRGHLSRVAEFMEQSVDSCAATQEVVSGTSTSTQVSLPLRTHWLRVIKESVHFQKFIPILRFQLGLKGSSDTRLTMLFL